MVGPISSVFGRSLHVERISALPSIILTVQCHSIIARCTDAGKVKLSQVDVKCKWQHSQDYSGLTSISSGNLRHHDGIGEHDSGVI